MRLLYITYIDINGTASSGSSVRPKKMYEAFCRLGVEVKLLECQQNKRKLRYTKVKEIIRWLNLEQPDVCYIESPSGPIFNYIDIKLIKLLHKKKIPIGYFYRDFFWLFPEMMKGLSWWKRMLIVIMNKFQLSILRDNCDIIYFPSEGATGLFSFAKLNKSGMLPPAAEVRFDSMPNEQRLLRKCIYIGAVSEVDGTIELIQALELLNRDEEKNKIGLILVCREKEWEKIKIRIEEIPEWLDVRHISGAQLVQVYREVDVAIFPRQKDIYLDLAVPVKLFEYFGFGKPVISTRRTEVERFVNLYQCGLLCGDSAEAIAAAIKEFYEDANLQKKLYENVRVAAKQNRWEDRAKQVLKDLTTTNL